MNKKQEQLNIEKEWKICKRNNPQLTEKLEKKRELWFNNLKEKCKNKNENTIQFIICEELNKIINKK
jgi:hypothetical protein